MRLTNSKRWIVRGSVVVAAAGGAFLAASCAGDGPPRPTCADVRDAGATDAVAIDAYTTVTTDAQPIEAFGMESDPGPQCMDCTQGSDLEIMTVADFEDGFAPAWFNYGEPGVPIQPLQSGEAIGEDGRTIVGRNPPQPWWGLQVATLRPRPGGERCGSKYALHMEGGRFTSWGGGFVTRHFIVRGEHMVRRNLCDVRAPGKTRGFPVHTSANMLGDRDRNRLPEAVLLAAAPNRELPGDPEFNGIGSVPKFMPEVQGTTAETATGCMFWASPVVGQPSVLGLDVSDFDGVSFWARRGPSGQSTLRVALVDDNTSEDLALNVERIAHDGAIPLDEAGARCERIKGCCRGCNSVAYERYVPPVLAMQDAGAKAATTEPRDEKRCHTESDRVPHFRPNPDDGGLQTFDHRVTGCGEFPEAGAPVVANDPCWITGPQEVANLWDDDFALCCPPTMEDEDPAELNGDPRYGGSECSPYVFQFDYSSGSYCHSEGDVLPERNQNRCGESFETAVVVDTEWQLYTIPWSELRRYTPDMPPFDPAGVWQISFYFGQGMLDTYIDDVGFYRKRPDARR